MWLHHLSHSGDTIGYISIDVPEERTASIFRAKIKICQRTELTVPPCRWKRVAADRIWNATSHATDHTTCC
jgi:hypothetical protein